MEAPSFSSDDDEVTVIEERGVEAARIEVDLTDPPARFRRNNQGGVIVPMFADLKSPRTPI